MGSLDTQSHLCTGSALTVVFCTTLRFWLPEAATGCFGAGNLERRRSTDGRTETSRRSATPDSTRRDIRLPIREMTSSRMLSSTRCPASALRTLIVLLMSSGLAPRFGKPRLGVFLGRVVIHDWVDIQIRRHGVDVAKSEMYLENGCRRHLDSYQRGFGASIAATGDPTSRLRCSCCFM
jgi:hypothetical protein